MGEVRDGAIGAWRGGGAALDVAADRCSGRRTGRGPSAGAAPRAAGHEPDRDTARSILAYAREHLAPYMRIRRLEFTDLPKTISGKIRRVELRGREHPDGSRIDGEYREEDFPELSENAAFVSL